MTIKEIFDDKSGPEHAKEIELIVDDFENASDFLLSLDLEKSSDQEKYRELWKLENTEITIDTWPEVPCFTEIEADTETEVLAMAKKLGFDPAKGIKGSVDYIYEQVHGITPSSLMKIKDLKFNDKSLPSKLKELTE